MFYSIGYGSLKSLMAMLVANGRNENSTARRAAPVKLPSDFNVEEYVSQRYVRKARSKQGVSILSTHLYFVSKAKLELS